MSTTKQETLQIPPMPNVEAFRDENGNVSHTAYNAALKAWERVAERVALTHESAAFWK